ncbi:MAG TPA: hypothetical protein VFF33_11725 [Ignavibacteriaceae bacterium]|nr:hypothetical protein [Ignavibacteriaceae bacterium]
MQTYDFGFSYVWEYDDDFLALIESSFKSAGLSTFIISDHNIDEVTDLVINKKIYFNTYLDRAWDVDDRYSNLGKILHRRHTYIFNPYKNVLHAIDKASMHLEFITAGLNVPYSIIIPPFYEEEDIFISVDNLAFLGRPFIIKPCNTTGGGIGVVTGAETLREVLEERSNLSNDKYILQEKVHPTYINGKRAWFRCFWAFGKVIPVYWDDQTHLYSEFQPPEVRMFNYKKLIHITRQIQELINLDFFSTEVVLTDEHKFIVIDYVNDQCDLRFKSKHFDGVPDNVIKMIVDNLIKSVLKIKKNK